jgi:hypothetical protein
MEKRGPKSYSGYAWAEESLLLGGIFLLIISNDDDDSDDLVSVGELFARTDPDRTAATATPAAGYPQAADLQTGLKLPPAAEGARGRYRTRAQALTQPMTPARVAQTAQLKCKQHLRIVRIA